MPLLPNGSPFAFDLSGRGSSIPIQDRLTQSTSVGNMDNSFADTGANVSGNTSTTVSSVNYLWYFAAIVAFLIVLKYASEHEKSEFQPSLVGIGVWNFVTIGIMAMLFLATMKVIVNKYHIKGVTDLVNFV